MTRIAQISGYGDAVLTCGHMVSIDLANSYAVGQPHRCPYCAVVTETADAIANERRLPQFATPEQLEAVASHYADTMRARGFMILEQDMVAIRRAAGIQDAWRIAFATVLK